MSRIFASLSVVAVCLIALVIFLGIRIGDYNGPYQKVLTNQRELAAQAHGNKELTETEILTLKNEIDKDYERLAPMRSKASLHKLLAILAAIITMLVNSVSITYFIGTNRWCKEVVQTYSLDSENLTESNSIKRRSFPWALLGMLTVLSIVTLGAASDPATLLASTWKFVQPHFWISMFGTAFIAFSFMNQYLCIHAHSDLVERILRQVKKIRQERGLEVES